MNQNFRNACPVVGNPPLESRGKTYGQGLTSNTPPDRERQIIAENERLEKELAIHWELLTKLRCRLTPIMSLGSGEGIKPTEGNEPTCSMAASLKEHADQVQGFNGIVAEFLRLIEL